MNIKTKTNYIYSFTNYLLRAFCVPSSMLGFGDKAIELPTLAILFYKTLKCKVWSTLTCEGRTESVFLTEKFYNLWKQKFLAKGLIEIRHDMQIKYEFKK